MFQKVVWHHDSSLFYSLLSIRTITVPTLSWFTPTTNPNWPEIRSQLRPGQDVTDINTCCGSVGPSICWPSKSPERIPAQGGFDLHTLHTRSVLSDFKTEERITIKVRHEPPLSALEPPGPLHDLVKRFLCGSPGSRCNWVIPYVLSFFHFNATYIYVDVCPTSYTTAFELCYSMSDLLWCFERPIPATRTSDLAYLLELYNIRY